MQRQLKLFLACFAVKLTVLLLVHHNQLTQLGDRYDSTKQPNAYDDQEYVELAHRFASRGEFVIHFGDHPSKTVYRTPGYPWILALIGTATAWNILAMLMVQSACLSVLPLIMDRLLALRQLPRGWAWLIAMDPLLVVMSTSFMTEAWVALSLLLVLYCWAIGKDSRWRGAAFCLFSLGLLLRPNAQYFLAVLLVLALLSFPKRWMTLLWFAVACLPVYLWCLRNQSVTGEFRLSTQTDMVIRAVTTVESRLAGEPPDVVDERFAAGLMDHYDPEFLEKYKLQKITGLVRDNKIDFNDLAVAHIKAHFWDYVKWHVLGMPRLLLGTARDHLTQSYGLGEEPPPVFRKCYDAVLLSWYAALYGIILAGFRPALLKNPLWILCVLFVGYNLALLGLFSWNTGGGLKRVPFLPHLYVMAAFSWNPLAAQLKSLPGRCKQWLASNP